MKLKHKITRDNLASQEGQNNSLNVSVSPSQLYGSCVRLFSRPHIHHSLPNMDSKECCVRGCVLRGTIDNTVRSTVLSMVAQIIIIIILMTSYGQKPNSQKEKRKKTKQNN